MNKRWITPERILYEGNLYVPYKWNDPTAYQSWLNAVTTKGDEILPYKVEDLNLYRYVQWLESIHNRLDLCSVEDPEAILQYVEVSKCAIVTDRGWKVVFQ